MAETITGRVVASYSLDCVVEDADGGLHRCLPRRRLGRPYCGDYVRFRDEAGGKVIEEILPRRNLLARPNYRGQLRPFAANVDLLVVVIAVQPPFERGLIDRYLVLAEHLELEALIWLNKLDLAAPAQREALLQQLRIYQRLGYPVLAGSSLTGEGVAALKARFQDKTGILVGQSGVGKSSLIQHLVPDRALRIGSLSEATGLGRHTTTETTLYHLPDGGDLIDSPGIRTLRLGHLEPEQIEHGFVELRAFQGECRFANCRHRDEPGCAVQAALQRGEIDPLRLASFHELLAE
ncbi:MAG: ribosome small subunit-dependent GTPase A [Xanthomonadaceae bacterium]|nr:ribosome small subunit-dependent GTPase A [Xanthomonadaceae bacterium]